MRWPRTVWRRDLVLAVLLTAVAQVELLLTVGSAEGAVGLLVINLLILPAVALRRVNPLLAICLAALGFGLDPLVGSAPVATPFLVLLGLLASLGWHGSLRTGVIGVAILLLVGLGPELVAGRTSAADVVVNGALVVGAWAVGYLLRRASDRRVQAELDADRSARRAVVAERQRIARDLHDSLAHALTLITLQAGGARERSSDVETRELLGGIERTGREALADMHRMLRLVEGGEEAGRLASTPGGVGRRDHEPLGITALPDLVGVSRGALQVELEVDLPREVPGTVSATIYRVVQEGLTNVARHSDARRARVGVTGDATGVSVLITDDGRPRASHVTGTGRGLSGLRERVDLLGGSIESGSTVEGWRLEARLPWATG